MKYRVRIPIKGAYSSVIVDSEKMYGDKLGSEIATIYKSIPYELPEREVEEIGEPIIRTKCGKTICEVCGSYTKFFVRSSDRYFRRNKVLRLHNEPSASTKKRILNDDYIVCFNCMHKYEIRSK